MDDVDPGQGPVTSVNEVKGVTDAVKELLGLKALTIRDDDDEVDRKIKAM